MATSNIGYIRAASVPSGPDQEGPTYMKTQNSAGWATNREDCVEAGAWGLVEVVNTKELTKLKEFLKNGDDTGVSYYTGGLYNAKSNKFVWAKTGYDVDENLLTWKAGHKKIKDKTSRIIAVLDPVDGVEFMTVRQTQSYRGICEFSAVI